MARRATTTWWWTSPTRCGGRAARRTAAAAAHGPYSPLSPPTTGPCVPQGKPRPLAPGERPGQAPRGKEGRPPEPVVRGLVQQHAVHQVQRGQPGELPGSAHQPSPAPSPAPPTLSASLRFQNEKSTTPVSKSSSPTSHADAPTPSSTSALRTAASKPPGAESLGESPAIPRLSPRQRRRVVDAIGRSPSQPPVSGRRWQCPARTPTRSEWSLTRG